MIPVFRREINAFLSAPIGYIAMVVFLIATGLFLWVFPGGTNLLDLGITSVAPFFELCPLLFLFLIPAICMKSFADEYHSGTMELLLSRPVSDLSIIGGKFFACWLLVLIALIPSILFTISIYQLSSDPSSLDIGAIGGSYLGLAGIGAVFVSIGIFSSLISKNQISAFILGVFLSFFMFYGFEYLSQIGKFIGGLDYHIQKMGMLSHYTSISRGVLDSRDLFYFISMTFLFIAYSYLILKTRKI